MGDRAGGEGEGETAFSPFVPTPENGHRATARAPRGPVRQTRPAEGQRGHLVGRTQGHQCGLLTAGHWPIHDPQHISWQT